MKPKKIELTEREIAEAKLAEAQAASTRAHEALAQARRAVLAAEERWETCDASEATAAREARDVAKKHLATLEEDGEHRRAAKQLALAQEHLSAVLTRERTARLEELKPRLAAFADEIGAIASKWVAFDRDCERLAAATAEATTAHHALFAEAKGLATDLGVPLADLGPSPDRAEVALLIRKTVSIARREDGADYRGQVLDMYLRGHEADWHTEGMSARDLDDVARTAERNRAIERDAERARAFAAGIEAGKQQQTTTNTETN
jgi:hypothetical protein